MRHANVLFRAGDLEASIGLFHPHAEWRDLQRAPDTPEALHGRTAIFALWTQWRETFDDFTVEIYEYIDAHPWVICPTRRHGIGKQSGATIDFRTADTYEVKERKIVRAVVSYPDVETALKAVGLAR